MLEDRARYIVVGLLALASASGVIARKKPVEGAPRKPTARCDLEVPAGWVRSPSPMPDHIAELLTDGTTVNTIIVGERPERARAVADAGTPGRVLPLNWGPPNAGTVETISLVAFPDAPVIEVIARHEEANAQASAAAAALVRSLRCAKP